jgi:hypothetical protein
MFRVAGVDLPGRPVTYFTKELAKWRADPTAKNNFSYKFTDADRAKKGIKGGNAPVKKAPNAPTLQAAIDNAGGELQRAGAGGSMSVIIAMQVGDGSGNGTTVRSCVKAGNTKKRASHLGSCSTYKVVPRAPHSDMCKQCQTAVMFAFLQ